MKDIIRGCGKRVAGGIYLATDLSPYGIPLNAFLFDPPWVPLDNDGVPHYPGSVGLHLVENPWQENVVDVWDWIGEEHYEYFPDFWEETKRYGVSRRISSGANFDLLSRKSQLIGFHRKGIYSALNKVFYKRLIKEWETGTEMDLCPQNKEEEHFCVSYLWQLVENAEENKPRLHTRFMPDIVKVQFSYIAASIPTWADNYMTSWIPAAMFHLPIHRIEIVEDKVAGTHEKAWEIVDKSVTDLPYVVVEE